MRLTNKIVITYLSLCFIVICMIIKENVKISNYKKKSSSKFVGVGANSSKETLEEFIIHKRRIVIIGSGVTGLGAAYRLYEHGILGTNTQVVVLETADKAGGLASSTRDDQGFLWDNGGHVVFSHYKYFDNVLNIAVKHWNNHKRAAFAFMKGSSGKRSFIAYPVQDNVMSFDKDEQQRILLDLEKLSAAKATKQKSRNFDEWLLQNFGNELCDVFMRKYNRKVWTVNPKEMNAIWVGERVAVPSIEKIKANARKSGDSQWGPNKMFRFPRYDGTGGIWTAVKDLIPQGWFHFGHKVVEIDPYNKTIKVVVENGKTTTDYNLVYDILINTSPLDMLLNITKTSNNQLKHAKQQAQQLLYSRTHIIGLGLSGIVPKHLADKSWMYFPDADSPFYRVTVFSKYAAHHVPNGTFWSLMCEAAQPLKYSGSPSYWSKDNILEKTISALILYNFITKDQIVSKYYRYLDHGYPIPSLQRESILNNVQPLLESMNIFSRGRFGGWRYEVGNQDHSFMQGVEVIDRILRKIPEETYPNPNLVNSMKASNRSLAKQINTKADYEVVVAHYNENLDWLVKEATHTHIYHKGKQVIPDLRFRQWQRLPNVGRESHTYLYHIIQNYYRLPNITIFIQGEYKLPAESYYCFTNITNYVEKAKVNGFGVKTLEWYNSWGRVNHIGKWLEWLKSGEMRRSPVTMGEMWDRSIGNPRPNGFQASLAGCFGVTRKRIHSRPLAVYQKLIQFIDDHSNPEEGHYFERLWHAIFLGN